jgi:sterol desaturase/sphingolipid hydroxylase (fatty acid hydroxylase superfamily)
MHLYYFMIKRCKQSYQQAKCIFIFAVILLPLVIISDILRNASPVIFHAILFLSGWVTWTFTEYILHRFWMHDKNSNSSIAQTHYYHHTHPTEIIVTSFHRIAMAIMLVVLILIAGYLNNYFTFLVGFLFGLESYFLMHQFLHLKITQQIFKRLVRYHIYHHCKYPNTCFGVCVPWWDDLFKTVPKEPKITQRIIDFYFKGDEDKPIHLNKAYNCESKMCSCQSNCSRIINCIELHNSL